MTQAPLFVFIYLIGLLVSLAIGPRRDRALGCALGFPVGLAVWVFLVLLILVVGLPYRPATAIGAGLIVMAGAGWGIWRRGIDRPTVWLAALWTALFAAASVAVSAVNLSLMSYDSHTFVLLGRLVGEDGAFAPGMLARLNSWGVFQVIAHSSTVLTAEDYLYALQPMLGLSFVPLFALLLWRCTGAIGAQGPARAIGVALVVTALCTIYMFHHHFLYIHTNLAAAIYLFTFCALFWQAEQTREASGVPIALLCLLAFAFQRVEAPPLALVFLALTVLQSELPRPAITPWLGGFCAAIAGWYFLLSRHVPADSEFLTPTRCWIVVGAALGFLGWWLASSLRLVQRINRRLPLLLAVAFALALGAAFWAKSEHMIASVEGWWDNLVDLPQWGQTWFALAALAVLGLVPPAPRFRQVFTLGMWISLAYILLLVLGRKPYYHYVADSANRMTLHVLPLIFFYLALKLVPPLARAGRSVG